MEDIGSHLLEPEGTEDRIVGEGGELQVTCIPPKSNPRATVTWSGPQPLIVDQGSLLIENVKQEDAGNYTCTISNMAENKHISFKLVVASKYYMFLLSIVISIFTKERM